MQPGESGIILLPGAPVEEFRTDDEDDWMLSLNGPPSPCDVSFENDNVLIQGKSSISKQPKRQKVSVYTTYLFFLYKFQIYFSRY